MKEPNNSNPEAASDHNPLPEPQSDAQALDFDERPADEAPLGAPHKCSRESLDCRCSKLHSFNWLEDIPGGYAESDLVEVQFKNTRKGYYRNTTNLPLEVGDMVAVEASPGHDIGMVTLMGKLVELRLRKAEGPKVKTEEIRRIFRKARPADMEKYHEARAREEDTMIRARRIADSLKLNMKIGDVEFQGDGNKAIFYYIADERVDFRQLIKVLAETFKVRIEMKQIGARQEAGRIGGIGPCGRPLCCSQWMTSFVSVATNAARSQDISLNPQKLAGQCAKLKCCLNFEVKTYIEASKKLPPRDVRLETADATFYHFKTDIFKRLITYSTDKSIPANLVTISADRVFKIIELNKAGQKPLSLVPDDDKKEKPKADFGDILGGEDDISRFDKKKRKRKKNKPSDQKPAQAPAPNGAQKPNPQKPKDNASKDNASKDNAQKENTPKDNAQKPKEANGQKNNHHRKNRPKPKNNGNK